MTFPGHDRQAKLGEQGAGLAPLGAGGGAVGLPSGVGGDRGPGDVCSPCPASKGQP